MPCDLFGDLHRPARAATRSRYTVPVSLAVHVLVVVGLVAGALLAPAVLPAPASGELILLAKMPVPAEPPVRVAPPHATKAAPSSPGAAPAAAPDGFAPEPEIDFTLPAESTRATAIIPGIEGFETVVAEPPAPPPSPAAPHRIGGDIRPPAKVVDVAPAYPPLALAARIQGPVIIEATIGIDGRVSEARVLRSPPMLGDAALAAVRQWVYRPTLLNGVPVSVVMTVTVRFDLR